MRPARYTAHQTAAQSAGLPVCCQNPHQQSLASSFQRQPRTSPAPTQHQHLHTPASAPSQTRGHRIHAPACSDVHSLHVASSTRQHSTALHALHCTAAPAIPAALSCPRWIRSTLSALRSSRAGANPLIIAGRFLLPRFTYHARPRPPPYPAGLQKATLVLPLISGRPCCSQSTMPRAMLIE